MKRILVPGVILLMAVTGCASNGPKTSNNDLAMKREGCERTEDGRYICATSPVKQWYDNSNRATGTPPSAGTKGRTYDPTGH
jgi:hypothetical protein